VHRVLRYDEGEIRREIEMRKIFKTYLPALLLLAFLAMILVTCGGGGGGGGGDRGDLTGLSVNGPSSMSEFSSETYAATASWSDNSTSTVTPTWSVNSQIATISPGGVLYCPSIDSDLMVTVTATYSSGGITETAAMDVTITNITTIPFTAQMVSGEAFFEENFPAGGGYDSSLSIFNADFSFEQYSHESPPDTSDYETGTWSIDASGNLIITVGAQGPVTVMLIADSSTEMEVVVDDGTGAPSIVILEKTVPVDPSLLPGTYLQSPGGHTWVFNANGTGTISIFGGVTFTWSVDSGVLKMPSSTGGEPWFYARASSQSTATSYTVLKVGFVEFLNGGFFNYYGGRDLTRQ
jgi:hypothetical protein